jgi:hypothetical protein
VKNALGSRLVLFNPKEGFGLGMESIEAQFILNPEKNEEGGGDPDRQTGDVEEGIAFVFSEIPDGDSKIMFQHSLAPRHNVFDIPGEGGPNLFPAGPAGVPGAPFFCDSAEEFFEIAGGPVVVFPSAEPLQQADG